MGDSTDEAREEELTVRDLLDCEVRRLPPELGEDFCDGGVEVEVSLYGDDGAGGVDEDGGVVEVLEGVECDAVDEGGVVYGARHVVLSMLCHDEFVLRLDCDDRRVYSAK